MEASKAPDGSAEGHEATQRAQEGIQSSQWRVQSEPEENQRAPRKPKWTRKGRHGSQHGRQGGASGAQMMPKGTKREPKGSQKGTRRWPMGPKWEPDGVAMRHIDMKNGKNSLVGKNKGFQVANTPRRGKRTETETQYFDRKKESETLYCLKLLSFGFGSFAPWGLLATWNHLFFPTNLAKLPFPHFSFLCVSLLPPLAPLPAPLAIAWLPFGAFLESLGTI